MIFELARLDLARACATGEDVAALVEHGAIADAIAERDTAAARESRPEHSSRKASRIRSPS
jgi:DNA-binding GntR family transcriptional regulator